ncbi:sugar-binding transcriptional regulator [Acetobacterium sp.]|uniref:sugar-binding transcriptional regulator n=1 Tax=Acetobacterium sp. TaxID=1872094 RepID=UPI0035935A85
MLSEVYNQSVCIMNAAVYMHYVEGKPMHQIAEILNISKSTVSRLLRRAINENVVKFEIEPNFFECTQLEATIRKTAELQEVLVVPVLSSKNEHSALSIKKMVALEGARYIQRIITDDDIIGLTWGGTMYHLIQYLNPCRKANAKVITMHGSIVNCDEKLAVGTLVRRAAMAFGGKNVSICRNGLFELSEDFELLKSSEIYQKMTTLFENINISISGVGLLYPMTTTLLASTNYLKPAEFQELIGQNAYADIMLRFIDKDGNECNTSMKNRTFSIELETYKKIPKKIIVASGSEKAPSIQALINGKLLDVLIIDQHLAKALVFPSF